MTKTKTWPFDAAPPADQQTYSTVRDLIAAAFTLCDVSKSRNWTLPMTYTDGTPCDLRRDHLALCGMFLDCLEFAVEADIEPDTLFADLGEERQGLEWGREGTDEWTRVEWSCDGRSTNGDYCFSLTCTDADTSSIWLESDGIKTFRDAIAQARDVLKDEMTP
jgi:hypothetical protein